MSTLVGHFVASPREREQRDRRRDEREEQGIGMKVKKQKKWSFLKVKHILTSNTKPIDNVLFSSVFTPSTEKTTFQSLIKVLNQKVP